MKRFLTANPLGQCFALILAAAALTFAIPMLILASPGNAAPTADSAPASAMDAACGTNGPNLENRWVDDVAIRGAANQRTGPSDRFCGARGVLQPTDDAIYYCATLDSRGREWTFLRNLRTGVVGWTVNSLLRDGGSHAWCGF
jgi:hypothetical protein